MELLARLRSFLAWPAPVAGELRQAIERGVTLADPLIRAVPHYERRLAANVASALRYCAGLAEEIPGPIAIDARVFAENALVHALFSRREQIGEMLARSRAVRDYLADAEVRPAEAFFALLGMRRQQRTVMGTALHGDQVRREVPQTLLYFSDHTLLELCADPVQTRHRVGELAFDSLAAGFAAELARRREARQTLHTQWQMARSAGGAGGKRALRELEARLGAAALELTPERVLAAFAEWLADPAAKLRLDPVTLSVDRMGVLAQPGAPAGGDGDSISFPELVARDRRRWILLLVQIGRAEAMQALAAADDATRYLLI